MKIKLLALGLICLFFSFCATSSQVKSQKPYSELHVYKNITVDQLWRSCELALEELGYTICEVNKNESFIVFILIGASWEEKGETDASYLEPYERSPKRLFPSRSAHLSLFISDTTGRVILICDAMTGGGRYTADRHLRNKRKAKSFFEKLDKILIK